MKQRLLHLLLLASAATGLQQARAQAVILKEDFESGTFPAPGWVTHDVDGDGKGWEVTSNAMFEMSGSSRRIAISFARDPQNYNTVYGNQDNWLVTPQFYVPNATVALEFEYCAQDLEHVEPIEVLISETGSDTSDFTTLWSTTADNGYEDEPVITTKKIGLSDYVGKNIRIAFRHTTGGTYALSIDNINIVNQNGPQTPKWYEVTADPQGGNSVYLKWLNPSKTTNGDDLESVSTNIYRDGQLIHTVTGQAPGSDGEWTDTTVTPGTYKYTLTAFNEEGETRKIAEKTVRVGEDIAAPVENTFAMLCGNGKVEVTWKAPTKGANSTYSTPTVFNPDNVSYIVKRSVNGGEAVSVAEGLTVTSYIDTDVEPANTYSYTVQASNPAGVSEVLEPAGVYIAPTNVADLSIAATADRINRSERVPFDTTDEFDVTQSLYFPDEMQFARGEIKSLIYKTYRSQTSTVEIPVRIYLSETTKENFTDKQWADLSAATKVYEGTLPLVSGANDTKIDLAAPFVYNGGNLVVTVIKDGKPNGSYSDCFFTIISDRADRSMTTSTYNKVDASSLPHSSYSDKPTANVASIRFLVELQNTGSLNGVVTDAANGSPLDGATVSVTDIEGLKAITDAEGAYTIPYIPTGTHNVRVEAVGYMMSEKELAITTSPLTDNVALNRLPNYTLSGTVKVSDTSLPAEGATVTLSGYETRTATVAASGAWSIDGVYSGQDYELAVSYPGYDTYSAAISSDSQDDLVLPGISLVRSLIPPFAVGAAVAADGSKLSLTWSDPLTRTGVPGEKSIGDVSTVYSDNGDYYSSDYNVAHLFEPASIAELNMAGLSVTGLRVYIIAGSGEFTAHVWKGDRNEHTILASKAIPADQLSSAGKWVEVTFDEPVEIKADGTYMIGVNCKNPGSRYPFGTAPSSSYVSGKNSVKFSEDGSSYDGYSAWCIIADCAVPASPSGIAGNENAPGCEYNVYRGTTADNTTAWEKITGTPIRDTSYVDNGWDGLSTGNFIYGVTAVYQNGESMKAYSEPVARSNDDDVAVTAFVTPVKSVDVRNSVNVTVTVSNLGEKPATDIPVLLRLNGNQVASQVLAATLNKGESANIDLGDVEIGEGIHTFAAATAMEGDMVASNDELSIVLPNMQNIELTGYRWSAYGNAGFMKIQSNNPEAADFRREFTTDLGLITASEYLNGKIYAYTATWYQAPQEFIEIDPVTWTITNMVQNEDTYILDMAYDYSSDTMYGLEPAGETVSLVKINTTTGATTPVGSLGQSVRALACDKTGNLYGISESGELLSIDPLTAATTEVGDTGFGTVLYLQSMAFDHNSNRLFWAATNDMTSGELREVDTTSGESRPLGAVLFQRIEPSEMVGLHTPYDSTQSGVGSVTSGNDGISINTSANGEIIVSTPLDATARIYDAAGACVENVGLRAGATRLTFSLPAGVYVVRITDADGRTATEKFILR